MDPCFHGDGVSAGEPPQYRSESWEDLRVITIAESAKFPFGAIRGAKGTSATLGIVGAVLGVGKRWMATVRIPLMPNVNPSLRNV